MSHKSKGRDGERERRREGEVRGEKGRRDHRFPRGNSILSTNRNLLRGCWQLPVSRGGGGWECMMLCSHYLRQQPLITLKPTIHSGEKNLLKRHGLTTKNDVFTDGNMVYCCYDVICCYFAHNKLHYAIYAHSLSMHLHCLSLYVL